MLKSPKDDHISEIKCYLIDLDYNVAAAATDTILLIVMRRVIYDCAVLRDCAVSCLC
jgi:hypothetical protein